MSLRILQGRRREKVKGWREWKVGRGGSWKSGRGGWWEGLKNLSGAPVVEAFEIEGGQDCTNAELLGRA